MSDDFNSGVHNKLYMGWLNYFILGIVLLSSSGFAWYDGYAYYTFDNSTEGYLNDSGSEGHNFDLQAKQSNVTYSTGVSSTLINSSVFIGASRNYANFTFSTFSNVKTIDYWFWSDDTSTDDSTGVSAGTLNDDNNIMVLFHDGTDLKFYLRYSAVTYCSAVPLFASGAFVHQWHHVVLTWNGSLMKGYFNNVNTLNCTTSVFMVNGQGLFIGNSHDTGANYLFDGKVDNVFLSQSNYSDVNVTDSFNSFIGKNFNAVAGGSSPSNTTGLIKGIGLNRYEMNSLPNMMFLFTLIFLWLALVVMEYTLGIPLISIFQFILGIFIGVVLSSVHIILCISFILVSFGLLANTWVHTR